MNNSMGTIKMSENTRNKPIRAFMNKILQAIASEIPLPPSQRVWLQKKRGVKIGKNVFIGSGVLIDEAYPEKVVIENNATVIARTIILAHAIYPSHFAKIINNKIAETKIGEGAYLGAGVIVMPGVKVGKYSIVGAGSIVTHDIPEYSKAVGVPARVIGAIDKELIESN